MANASNLDKTRQNKYIKFVNSMNKTVIYIETQREPRKLGRGSGV